MSEMTTFDNLIDAIANTGTIGSVHHKVARLEAARVFRKPKDWPPNVVSIAEARARRWMVLPGQSVKGQVEGAFFWGAVSDPG
jgi:hypothetical protein